MNLSPDQGAGLLATFVAALRRLREQAGNPTFRTMSRRVKSSAATLCRVESSERVPSLAATLDYVRACGGDLSLWQQQHRRLRAAVRTSTPASFVPWRDYFEKRAVESEGKQPTGPPLPQLRMFAEEMRRLRFESGLTLQEIADRTAEPDIVRIVGSYGLSVSTISDLCNPKLGRLPRRKTLHGFLLAVNIDLDTIDRWLTARNILAEGRDADDPLVDRRALTNAPQGLNWVQPTPRASPLTRLRVLRNDLSHGSVVSQGRICDVLISLGIDDAIVKKIVRDPHLAQAFVSTLYAAVDGAMQSGPRKRYLPQDVMEATLPILLKKVVPQLVSALT